MMNSSATLEMTLVSALVKDNYQVKYLHDRVSPEIFSLNSLLCFCPVSHFWGFEMLLILSSFTVLVIALFKHIL